jgi:ABC-2 type transport system ATP-binding protein
MSVSDLILRRRERAVSKDEATVLTPNPCAISPDAPMNVPEMVNSDATPAQSPAAGPEGSAAIDVAHLIKLYKTTRAVDDVSFRIARGSITGLLGGNGAGKTTTIAMIMGLVLPTSGRVQVLGHAMPEQSAEVLGRMNFESPYVDMPMRLTVRQNLTIFGRLYAVKDLAARIDQLASDFDLRDFLDRANGKLSAGQKTRVALAKALINQPELLLLDEPTASLDPDTADWVRQHLQDYRKAHHATILLASHNMLEVERLCDRVIIMKRGRIEDDDSPDQIMARYNRTTLEEVFLDVARGRAAEAAS